jgi:heme exporter protein A
MFTATDLACSRGERKLFDGVSFSLERSEWLHVKGENGAGKTTMLRTLIGLSPADHGQICWNGADIHQHAEDYRRAFVYLGHQAGVKDELTPVENLKLALMLDGFEPSDDEIFGALGRMGLRGREELPARVLSAGQRRRVLLARLLLRPAELWVLDEPFNALDVAGIELLRGMIRNHLDAGGIAVLTSHHVMPLSHGREIQL